MLRRFFSALVGFMLVLALVPAQPASARLYDRGTFDGHDSYHYGYYFDWCRLDAFFLYVGKGLMRYQGGSEDWAGVGGWAISRNYCDPDDHDTYVRGFVQVSPDAVQFNEDGSGAVKATIELMNYMSGQPAQIDLDLAFTTYGDIWRVKEQKRTFWGGGNQAGYHSNYSIKSSSADGIVALDGHNLLHPETDGAWHVAFGEVHAIKDGYVHVLRELAKFDAEMAPLVMSSTKEEVVRFFESGPWNVSRGINYAETADIYSVQVDETGCIEREVSIQGGRYVTDAHHQMENPATVFVSVSDIDWCNWEYLGSLAGVKQVTREEFDVRGNMSVAEFNTTVPLRDWWTGETADAVINVKAEADGQWYFREIFNRNSVRRLDGETYTGHIHEDEGWRTANAAGSVLVGGREYLTGSGWTAGNIGYRRVTVWTGKPGD